MYHVIKLFTEYIHSSYIQLSICLGWPKQSFQKTPYNVYISTLIHTYVISIGSILIYKYFLIELCCFGWNWVMTYDFLRTITSHVCHNILTYSTCRLQCHVPYTLSRSTYRLTLNDNIHIRLNWVFTNVGWTCGKFIKKQWFCQIIQHFKTLRFKRLLLTNRPVWLWVFVELA